MNCNRLRVTSDCKLKPCLLRNDNLVDVRGMTDEELHKAMHYVVSIREPFFKDIKSQARAKGLVET
jgi:cyclic pyranopterin phosphate synthase